jgi:uncharacterized membrane protein
MQKKSMMFAAALAGLLAAGCSKGNDAPKAADKPAASKVKCEGANACAGHGGCAGAGHECAGKNGCKGQGWVETASVEECSAKGGKAM